MNDATHYSALTNPMVIQILERFHMAHPRSGAKRLRLYYGDAVTGRAWGDVEEGYISRSMGAQKIPILIANARSMGGPGILDDCVIKIEYANKKDGGVLWQHPEFQPYIEQA